MKDLKTTLLGIGPFLAGIVMDGAALAKLAHIDVYGVSITGDPWDMLMKGTPMVFTGLIGFYAADSRKPADPAK